MILQYLITLRSFRLHLVEGRYKLNSTVEDFDSSMWENQHGNQL